MKILIILLLFSLLAISGCKSCTEGFYTLNWSNVSAQTEWDKRQDIDIKDNRQALTNYATADSKLQAELETKITIYESILGSIGVAGLGIGVWYIKKRIDK